MRIHHVRRLSQGFFFGLFVFLCAVTRMGTRWTDVRGWPVNWFLQLDPLAGLGTALGTGTLFAGLLWGVATLSLTMLLGRFFLWLDLPLRNAPSRPGLGALPQTKFFRKGGGEHLSFGPEPEVLFSFRFPRDGFRPSFYARAMEHPGDGGKNRRPYGRDGMARGDGLGRRGMNPPGERGPIGPKRP